MRERAQAIGAILRIDAAVGRGTKVAVELPRDER
jgi:signal transduction histidine kinase